MMNATITEHLVESIHVTFENAFAISIHEMPSPKEETLLYSKIGITDNTKTQDFIIGMPKEALVFLGGLYFGYDNDFSNEELEDLIKELSNLVLGRVKARYLSINKEATLEIPKIVKPKNIETDIARYFKVKDTYIMIAY